MEEGTLFPARPDNNCEERLRMKSSKKCQVPLYADEKSMVIIVTFISSVENGTLP